MGKLVVEDPRQSLRQLVSAVLLHSILATTDLAQLVVLALEPEHDLEAPTVSSHGGSALAAMAVAIGRQQQQKSYGYAEH